MECDKQNRQQNIHHSDSEVITDKNNIPCHEKESKEITEFNNHCDCEACQCDTLSSTSNYFENKASHSNQLVLECRIFNQELTKTLSDKHQHKLIKPPIYS